MNVAQSKNDYTQFDVFLIFYFLCITCVAEDSGTHRRTDVREQREDGGRKKDTAGQRTETQLKNTAAQKR